MLCSMFSITTAVQTDDWISTNQMLDKECLRITMWDMSLILKCSKKQNLKCNVPHSRQCFFSPAVTYLLVWQSTLCLSRNSCIGSVLRHLFFLASHTALYCITPCGKHKIYS